MTADKQHAHEMLDRLGAGQLAAVVHLVEVMTDPATAALRNAPVDDEPFTEAERKAVAEAGEWLKHNQPITHQEVLVELGLTMADWEKMAEEPMVEEAPHRNR